MTNRIGLDVMRSIAIFLVLYLHSLYLLPTGMGKYLKHLDFLLSVDGVGIFFVLSGFLIGRFLIDLEEKKSISLKEVFRFLIRRWLRTLPNYYLIYLFVLFAGNQIFEPEIVLFIHNFSKPYFGSFQESWSLSVEEFTYLLFPAFLWIFSRFTQKSYYPTGLFLFFLGLWFQYKLTGLEFTYWERTVIGRFSSIIVGLLFCKVFFNNMAFFKRFRTYFFLIAFFLLIMQHSTPNFLISNSLYFTVESVFFTMSIPFFFYLDIQNKFLNTFFYHASKYSYSLYLINVFPFQYIILPWIKNQFFNGAFPGPYPFIFDYLSFWILVPVISHFLYQYWEKPFMNLRKYF